MKTPDVIKKGLERCKDDRCICDECEFSDGNVKKWRSLMGDALAYIVQLEDAQEWLDEQPTIRVVPKDFYEKCMDAVMKKRILVEKTNRRIIENYAPVVHANWIMDDSGNHRCSNCSERLPFVHCYSDVTYVEWYEEIEETLYCPYCGAKMDDNASDSSKEDLNI